MHWAELEERQPRLAAKARERLIEPGVLLVVSLRADGTARLSPVEPYVLEGRLLLSMLWQSHKARDLQRDPRVLVHGIVTGREGDEGELKLRGRAVEVSDLDLHARYATAVTEDLGWSPEVGRFHLFEVDVEHLAFVRYDAATGDQYVTTWPPGAEFVRRGTTATTVGRPEPYAGLLS
ncbi:MAG TPA: pyridoxamine 5'-phosphate oxidase family protein [Nocardioides sp.]|uniref:pyridoxamine 5'-phosphate oxidase family protein n=1 Tax=Nocardioides sp. TaxID=35761 RepID=UPI002E36F8F8|nr:pyridoxamine 5'-phosphate oxidase family protein [Nocardioides sp.]HEX5088609.1 pyridoxamine 5'-phosphate oxidase family protein [Nocardioides sp.]